MNPNPLLITGPTGNVGREVVNLLHAQGVPCRAAVYRPDAALGLPAGVQTVPFDFTEPATFQQAFAGVEKLFLVRPPQLANVERDLRPALEAAVQAGVSHVVFLSLLGADTNRIVPHAKIERLLEGYPLATTFLRAGFFMQNLTTTHLAEIRDRDEIFIPAGHGKTAFIDVRDIAAVAARALTEPGHEGQAYELTGGAALDYEAVARLLTAALGRPIRYSRPSLGRFAWRHWRQGRPLGYVAVTAGIYLTTRWGLAAKVTADAAALLGREPISMAQFVEDHAPLWAPPSPPPRSPS